MRSEATNHGLTLPVEGTSTVSLSMVIVRSNGVSLEAPSLSPHSSIEM